MSRRSAKSKVHSPPDSSPNLKAGTTSFPSTPVARGPRLSLGSTLRSPAATPSISATTPFDWDAARSMKPPPYGTPAQNRSRGRKSFGVGTPAKRVVKIRGWVERITDVPTQLFLDFPENLPLPPPRTSAFLLGGLMHFLNLCVRISQNQVPDTDFAWEDMYREREDPSWFDWTIPMTLLLIALSLLNTLYLLSRTKTYTLRLRSDPVLSPNAFFAPSDMHSSSPLPSLPVRLWHTWSLSWRWLFNLGPPEPLHVVSGGSAKRVQRLEVWTPGELEITLFCVYSPAHALMWILTNPSNWIGMMLIMVIVGTQLEFMVRSYTLLVKDKEIISAEVLHEYNEGFVYPRVIPIRKDVAVMTEECEANATWDKMLPHSH